KQLLKNGQWSASWGKYTVNPSTNVDGGKKAYTTLVLKGRSLSPSGCEGEIVYDLDSLGSGSIKLSYSCPYSGDNYGRTDNHSADLVLLGVYGQIGSRLGMDMWGWDESKWGREGDIPITDSPLSLLFVVRDM
ncbi:MAG TPA: hypothetical protein VFQ06_13830, partial [Nitrospira sp.]|nr:hypothetical protein [Nitrospira sp.]